MVGWLLIKPQSLIFYFYMYYTQDIWHLCEGDFEIQFATFDGALLSTDSNVVNNVTK